MASLVNELSPEVTLSTTGGNASRKVYSFKTETDANTYYLLACTSGQASDMATQIASDLTETISTAVAVISIYEMTGIQQ